MVAMSSVCSDVVTRNEHAILKKPVNSSYRAPKRGVKFLGAGNGNSI